ncbi:flagellar protein FlgJ [Nitrosomonas cryotolerans]|uniref:Peptidoglycan hydrolase FlgJ n=1 Tax=Nitrosomonas cryotolerans ATCC 49181 TaxID=1131553 RepID=A0A1N6ILF5_9PROT|nr:flagellar assembly peptidoglycan hydrolase FlgJ [Nitrosomonas cryotolerans]SFP37152.1 flagellar protein FlgJ [Nitrosomonas cryotolerans]SIO32878.1 flagellar protein FlgJ [Nitrosomonas cryotolerans ATCC 49181]
MINSYDISGKLAIDTKNADNLRLLAKQSPDQGLKEAAKQFEALFMHMMLKSMREATSKDGLLDSQQTAFYTQMLDQQLAQSLSSKGMGIADIMVQQLTRKLSEPVTPETPISNTQAMLDVIDSGEKLISMSSENQSGLISPSIKTTDVSSSIKESNSTVQSALTGLEPAASFSSSLNQPEDFVSLLLPHARLAEQATGIPAHFMIAQAALESGWGKHEIRHADNSSSYNLFGIKAGRDWKGAVVETVTTEYINGVPQRGIEKFRAYNSFAEGFRDYANLLLNNPRYAAVIKNQDAAAFAYGLQQAGYATDPKYADKLIRILNSNTFRNHLTI